jgi:hypothetical protein
MTALIALGYDQSISRQSHWWRLARAALANALSRAASFRGPVLSAPNIPPNSVAKHRSGKKGTESLGSVGTEAKPYNTRNFVPPICKQLERYQRERLS